MTKKEELVTITLDGMTEAQELAVRIVMDAGKNEERERIEEFILHYSSRIDNGEDGWLRDEITLSVTQFLDLLYSDKSRLNEVEDE
jgi:hypothetical protein